MYPDDRVLVSVVRRKRDLQLLVRERWYRIPRQQAHDGIYAEYIAFFLSGTAAKALGASGVYYYGRRMGVELVYRHELLPNESDHSRANEMYYKINIESLLPKVPPILNPKRHIVAFIYTTWDRFVAAQEITDLYSCADSFVDRTN